MTSTVFSQLLGKFNQTVEKEHKDSLKIFIDYIKENEENEENDDIELNNTQKNRLTEEYINPLEKISSNYQEYLNKNKQQYNPETGRMEGKDEIKTEEQDISDVSLQLKVNSLNNHISNVKNKLRNTNSLNILIKYIEEDIKNVFK